MKFILDMIHLSIVSGFEGKLAIIFVAAYAITRGVVGQCPIRCTLLSFPIFFEKFFKIFIDT